MSRIGGAMSGLRAAGAALRAQTMATAVGAAGAGLFLGREVGPTLARPFTDEVGKAVDQEVALRARSLLERARAERLLKAMAENEARLAALDPHLYYEVQAGRRLPRGAVVFGGQVRTDLLEELTRGMAAGEYREPPSPEDDLAALLGQ